MLEVSAIRVETCQRGYILS